MIKIQSTTLIFLFIICLVDQIIPNNSNKPYVAPGNAKFPYGDEQQINCDLSQKDINNIVCSNITNFIPEGRCPLPPFNLNQMQLINPYVKCPNFMKVAIAQMELPNDQSTSTNVQCKTCDLRTSGSDSTILLKCINCFDIPKATQVPNLDQKEILYDVYFMEITNYTAVQVQGKENLLKI